MNAALNVNIIYIWMWTLIEVKYQKGVILAPVDLLSFPWLAFLPGVIYKLILPAVRALAGMRRE